MLEDPPLSILHHSSEVVSIRFPKPHSNCIPLNQPGQERWCGITSFCGGGQRRQLLAGALHPPLQLRSPPCAALPPPPGPGSPRERAGLGQRAKAGHVSPPADAWPGRAAGYAVSCSVSIRQSASSACLEQAQVQILSSLHNSPYTEVC